MKAENKNKSLVKRLKNGIPVREFVAISSINFFYKLQQKGLIWVSPMKKVFLTDRGRIAREFGINSYLELEELENDILDSNPKTIQLQNIILFTVYIILLFLLCMISGFF